MPRDAVLLSARGSRKVASGGSIFRAGGRLLEPLTLRRHLVNL